MKFLFLSLFFLMPTTLLAQSSLQDETIFLREFHNNLDPDLLRLPQMIVNGKPIEQGFIRKDQAPKLTTIQRRVMMAPRDGDRAEQLVETHKLVSNLKTLHDMKLTSAHLVRLPWADSYWPLYKGMIGIRYADERFPNSKDWSDNHDYIRSNSAQEIVDRESGREIDSLSPAEKYDLLVGDSDWTLTHFAWHEGQKYFDRSENVPTWMGICHGWAGASHMLIPTASRQVRVNSPGGIPVTFYPSDVKALQSLLWANARVQTRFIGTKCKQSEPEKDENGRILDPDCFDTNPATFHLALTNQIGIHQRSFVMNASYFAEVWNFPLVSYRFRYFNPKTLGPSDTYVGSVIDLKDYDNDKFRKYRSPQARFVVGIIMDDTYVVEIVPNHNAQVQPPVKTVRHYYDLELDDAYNIIGGEWYNNAHPDFLWTYDSNAKAMASEDAVIKTENWAIRSGFPRSWVPLAQKASRHGTPLSTVVDWLLASQNAESQ